MNTSIITRIAAFAVLTAVACAPELGTLSDVHVDPISIDLGTQRPEEGLPVSVRLSNLGTTEVQVFDARLTGAMANFAGLAELDLPILLAPGAVVIVEVTLVDLPTVDDVDLGLVLELDVTGDTAPSSGCGSSRSIPNIKTLQVPIYVLGDARCDRDEDGYYDVACGGDDCDDLSSSVFPGADELCNDVDDNCDNVVDDAPIDGITFYEDADQDGFGDEENSVSECALPVGYATVAGDCADGNPTVHPGADEICDSIDQNCDGIVDNDPISAPEYFFDGDEDGYGDPTTGELSCTQAGDRVPNSGDCDDERSGVFPGADEVCNNRDDDCNGAVDDGSVDAVIFYGDRDRDGYGTETQILQDCALPDGFAAGSGDCDDTDPDVYPFAPELCDGEDNNCNGFIDEGAGTPWFIDRDSDGFGTGPRLIACEQLDGAADNRDDCDDSDPATYPGAPELCDDIDQDCDGDVDDTSLFYVDSDGDGYGDPGFPIDACDADPGTVGNDQDCDDSDRSVNPDGVESCNAVDDNCDGRIDDGDVCPCPVEWFEDRAYAFCVDIGLPFDPPWALSGQACEQAGYDLVSIHSADENAFVARTSQSYQQGTWGIGFNDRRSEGVYGWRDGSVVDYVGWGTGEPNNSQNEDCAEIRPNGAWNDAACFGGKPFICATPPE